MITRITEVQKNARKALILLWCSTVLLVAYMTFHWVNSADDIGRNSRNLSIKDLFVDEMLLSFKDLQFEKSTSLINLKLNRKFNEDTSAYRVLIIPQDRNRVYYKILEQKLNSANSNPSNGFSIKPVPQ
jgi:hypothetical protein